jgi:hypothetical protein
MPPARAARSIEPVVQARAFISYRREDAPGHAGRLYDRLQQEFGAENVFIDVDTLLPGDDFVDAIGETLSQCSQMIALIGPRWLTATDDHGRARLDDESDFVRVEIQTALERRIRTVPVLVERAAMPQAQQLHESLRPLTRRQAIELSDTRWASDVGALVERIKRAAAPPSATERPAVSGTPNVISAEISNAGAASVEPSNNLARKETARDGPRRPWVVWSGVGAVVLTALAILAMLFNRPSRNQVIIPKEVKNESPTTPVAVNAAPGARQEIPSGPPALPIPTNRGHSTPTNAARSVPNRGQQLVNQGPKLPVRPCRDDDNDANGCMRACDDGDARSCTNLGLMYATGRGGLMKDETRAVALYQRACDTGNADGCNNLGNAYQDGRGGVTKDLVRPVALFQRACDAGSANGCNNLGNRYFGGEGGLTQDPARAVALYQRACDAGNGSGCNNLGVQYARGQGGLTQKTQGLLNETKKQLSMVPGGPTIESERELVEVVSPDARG